MSRSQSPCVSLSFPFLSYKSKMHVQNQFPVHPDVLTDRVDFFYSAWNGQQVCHQALTDLQNDFPAVITSKHSSVM